MTEYNTEHWIDLYSVTLDRLAEFLADPQKMFDRLGINPYENGQNVMPGKMEMEQYRELMASWKRVKDALRTFGLTLTDELELSPEMADMAKPMWSAAPWLEVYRKGELIPLRFTHRDALTALGFFNFFIQQCEQMDPTSHLKKSLEAQGITAENFDQHAGLLGISNPWK